MRGLDPDPIFGVWIQTPFLGAASRARGRACARARPRAREIPVRTVDIPFLI